VQCFTVLYADDGKATCMWRVKPKYVKTSRWFNSSQHHNCLGSTSVD